MSLGKCRRQRGAGRGVEGVASIQYLEKIVSIVVASVPQKGLIFASRAPINRSSIGHGGRGGHDG